MLIPLNEQIADLEVLNREIQALREELEATKPPPSAFLVLLSGAGHCLWVSLPWVVATCAVCACIAGGYWLWTQLPSLPAAPSSASPTLGISPALDAFVRSFQTGAARLSLMLGVVGLGGYIGSLMDNPFSPILTGASSYFIRAAILGVGTFLLTALGLLM